MPKVKMKDLDKNCPSYFLGISGNVEQPETVEDF